MIELRKAMRSAVGSSSQPMLRLTASQRTVLFVCCILLAISTAARAAGLGEESYADAMDLAAWVGPLGINPLLALGGMGAAAWWEVWAPPVNLVFIREPICWGLFLALGMVNKFGRSFKLTKPVAELLGTGESAVGIGCFAAGLFGADVASSSAAAHSVGVTTVAHAGLGGWLLFGVLGIATLFSVMVVRTAMDLLIWVSPLPLVDAVFQAVKLATTGVLVVLAVVAPWLAILLNLAIVIACLLVARFALRVCVFGAHTMWFMSLGRGSRPTSLADHAHGGDEIRAWSLSISGAPRLGLVAMRRDGDAWLVQSRGWLGSRKPSLFGPISSSDWLVTPMGILVRADNRRALVCASYVLCADELAARYGRPIRRPTDAINAAWQAVWAQGRAAVSGVG